jgi:geranylgeranyl diphosphate synthase type I
MQLWRKYMTTDHLVHAAATPSATATECLDRVRCEVESVLDHFLDRQSRAADDPCLPPLVEVVREFLSGGKRLRPLFCYCGWLAAGGAPDEGPVPRIGAALELFHAFALIHDDVMDGSDLRRGRPTVHRVLAGRYRDRHERRKADRLGTNLAILLGDLCLAWSDELLQAATPDEEQLRDVLPTIHAMRTEVLIGQYLDVTSGWADDTLERSWQTIRYKTAGYTVERPLQVGAVLAGADGDLLDTCTAYGRPLGEAFQLRDDFLGVFGEPDVTGKPALDDFREGKFTVLMALTWQGATAEQRTLIRALHGNPGLDEEGAQRLRAIIRATGADVAVEGLIDARVRDCLSVVHRAPVPDVARRALCDLVTKVARRRN